MSSARNRYALLALLKLLDLAVVLTAFIVALVVELHPEPWQHVLTLRVQVLNVLFMAAYLAVCHLLMRALGLYRSHRLSSWSEESRDVAWVMFVATTLQWAAGRMMHFEYATASFVTTFASLMFIGLVLERGLLRVVASAIRRHGRNLRNVVILGREQENAALAARLRVRGDLGYAVVEMLSIDGDGNAGAAERLGQLLEAAPVDEVFVTLPLDSHLPLIRDVVRRCEEQGITIRMLSSFSDLMVARAHLDEFDGRPVITIFSGPADSGWLAAKRMIDVVGASVALLLTAPLWLVIAVAIKLDSPGPVLFVQERVGLGGRRFRFYKFRTMVVDAEQRQAALEQLNEASGPVFKIREDPRITPLGRFLRHFSLDEIPQFLNVLVGDMSLVGPRPLPVRDVDRFDTRAHRRRFSVRPGITCLWQVGGRVPEFNEWIRTDMEYIDNWSLALDLKILAKTIPVVLTGRGAY